jgi:hypothetical protein
VSPGVVNLNERPNQPVDRESDEQGGRDQDDNASDGRLLLHFGESEQHDLRGQDEVGGDGALDDRGLVHRSLLGGVVGAEEALQDLLPALEAQVGAADDERHGQKNGRHRRQQQSDRQDDEKLVAERAQRDPLNDRQLAVRSDAGDVLGRRSDIVHCGGRDFRGRLDGHGGRVVDGRYRQLGERGDVVEKSEEA